MNSFKILFEIIKFSKKESILFIVFGSIVSAAEVLIISNSKGIYNFFTVAGLNNYLILAILISIYSLIIIMGLFLIYFAKKYAFIVSHNYCYYRILKIGKTNFIRNTTALNSALTIERERLAREIIAPLFNLYLKIILPLLTLFLLIKNKSINSSIILLVVVPLIVIFIFSSNQFKKFALRLEKSLEQLMTSIQIFVKTFDSQSRFIDYFGGLNVSKNENHELAKIEGYIDSVSQALDSL